MQRNLASQKWRVFAFDADGVPVTGDALNITAKLSKDGGTATALTDVNPVEIEAGYYDFDVSQTESDAASLGIIPVSATAGVVVVGSPAAIFTTPINYSVSAISATGVSESNLVEMDGQAGPATAIADQYDGVTGLTGDLYPSTQGQVGSIGAVGGSGANIKSDSFTLVSGVVISGTVSDTGSLGVYHVIDSVAGVMEGYYEFNIGLFGVPSSARLFAHLRGSNDSVDINVYDFAASSWDVIDTLSGANTTADVALTPELLTNHVGTGANVGVVRIGFSGSGLSSATLSVNTISCSYGTSSQSAAYFGAVWLDTIDGAAGTVLNENGIAFNPSSNITDALSLSTTTSLKALNVSQGSSFTTSLSLAGKRLIGHGYTVTLSSADTSNAHIDGAIIGGSSTSDGGEVDYEGCEFLAGRSLDSRAHMSSCSFDGDVTYSSTVTGLSDSIFMENCTSGVEGGGAPLHDFSAVTKTTSIKNRLYGGGCDFTINAFCTLSHEVVMGGRCAIINNGGIAEVRGAIKSLTLTSIVGAETTFVCTSGAQIIVNGTGGSLTIYGGHGGITDNSAGAVTVTDLGADIIDLQLILEDTADMQPKIGTPAVSVSDDISTTYTKCLNIEADTQDLQSRTPAALVLGRTPAVAQVVDDKAGYGLAADQSAVTVGAVSTLHADAATAVAQATTDGKVDGIAAKTSSLTFTKAGEIDSNIKSINDVEIIGDGSATPYDVP